MENKKKIFIAYTAFVLSVLTIIGCIVWFFSVPTYAAPIEPTESVEEIEYITSSVSRTLRLTMHRFFLLPKQKSLMHKLRQRKRLLRTNRLSQKNQKMPYRRISPKMSFPSIPHYAMQVSLKPVLPR